MASTGQSKEDRHVVVRLQYVWECFYHSKNIERCKHFIHPIDIILFTPWVFLSLFCHFLSWFSNYWSWSRFYQGSVYDEEAESLLAMSVQLCALQALRKY